MDLASVLFWIFAAVLVGAALMVVGMRNIVHSALGLIVLFAMAAGIYVLLDAEFIAMVQILVYAGAVTILILFALMLTRIRGARHTNPTNKLWPIALVICTALGAAIIYAVTTSSRRIGNVTDGTSQLPAGINNVARIGELLYSPDQYSYVLPFEIASIVLLVAIMGAIIIVTTGREE